MTTLREGCVVYSVQTVIGCLGWPTTIPMFYVPP